jgi:hypothetical protein
MLCLWEGKSTLPLGEGEEPEASSDGSRALIEEYIEAMPMILKAAGPRMFCFQRRENRLISSSMIFIVWPQRPHSAVQPSER